MDQINLKRDHIQMKAVEHFFPVVLFIVIYQMDFTFESVDEIQMRPFK